jgi:hypothetical protein
VAHGPYPSVGVCSIMCIAFYRSPVVGISIQCIVFSFSRCSCVCECVCDCVSIVAPDCVRLFQDVPVCLCHGVCVVLLVQVFACICCSA